MPSELVNSVIRRPQPPSPRITRRKSVSVTPAIGASTAAGRMVKSRIWKDTGIMLLRYAVSLRYRGVALQKFIQFQEAPAERGAVGRPLWFAGIDSKRGANRCHLGIHVVQVVENHRFADHWQLRGTKFVLAVMADQEMLDDGFQICRKTSDGIHG